jgi:hypothetical protein
MEVTSSYYNMDNYFASFLACVVGAFVYRWTANAISGQQYWVSILQTDYKKIGITLTFWDLVFFVLLGLIIAATGVLFIALFQRVAAWRRSLLPYYTSMLESSTDAVDAGRRHSAAVLSGLEVKRDMPGPMDNSNASSSSSSAAASATQPTGPMSDEEMIEVATAAAAAAATADPTRLTPLPWYSAWFVSPYTYAIVVVVLTAFLNYPGLLGDFMGLDTHSVMHSLFGSHDLDDTKVSAPDLAKDWGHGSGVYVNLLIFAGLRLLLCAVSITLPLPCGMFFPCMAVGAALGRFWGNAMVGMFSLTIAPGVFAVAGAAGMVASVTHSLSTLLILFEVTGQLYFAYPVMVCLLGTSSSFSLRFLFFFLSLFFFFSSSSSSVSPVQLCLGLCSPVSHAILPYSRQASVCSRVSFLFFSLFDPSSLMRPHPKRHVHVHVHVRVRVRVGASISPSGMRIGRTDRIPSLFPVHLRVHH